MRDVSSLGVFFKPASVAVVGASSDPKKPGHTALKNMLSMGYNGRVYPVNLREETVLGLPCYKSVLDIPEPLDLCVFLVSADLTIQVSRELAQRNSRSHDVKAAVCMSAGFGELNTPEGKQRERELVDTLKSASIRLVGPNCLGVMDTASGFNTNFDIGAYPRGGISVLTQSGAFGNSFLLWAGTDRLIGLNKFVSIGNMADVDMAELLAFWKQDESTRVIAIYLEGLTDARAFFDVARDVATAKPVVVLKSGRSEVGSTAALSHTGAVAGADAIYEGAFRQAGIVRARTVLEFYETLRSFEKQPIPAGNRVAVLTHMGGPGTICIDEIAATPALQMAKFSSETEAALKAIVSPAANIGHPDGYIDLTAAHYENLHNQVLRLLFADPNIDMVLQILAPSAFLDQKLLAREVAQAFEAQSGPAKPLLNVVTFGRWALDLKQGLNEAGLPNLEYPDIVAKIAGNMANYATYRQAAAFRASEAAPATTGSAAELISSAEHEGRISLLEPEAYEVCGQYGISVPPFRLVGSAEAALTAAKEVGYPVVLKVVSAEILHKTDVGGVMLGITSDSTLKQAYKKLVQNIARVAPHIKKPRVLVQKMMPAATELVLGAVRDRLFGPVVMFGLGGIYIEAIKLVGFRLAPLDARDAAQLIHETLPPVLIRGARGRKPMHVESIARAIVALGRLMQEQSHIEQVDLNPFLPYEDGSIAVDARIILASKATNAAG
jgi:acetyltransferase